MTTEPVKPSAGPIEIPREIYDLLPNKKTVTILDLRRAIAKAAAARDSSAPAQQGEQPKAQPSSAEAVAWFIHWHRPDSLGDTRRVSFNKCHEEDGTSTPLYATPPAAVPIPELQAMCERWLDPRYLGHFKRCADELRVLIDKFSQQ